MGTERTRAEKIAWMMEMKHRIKDKGLLLRNFMLRFSSTEKTANEIYNIVHEQDTLKQKRLK